MSGSFWLQAVSCCYGRDAHAKQKGVKALPEKSASEPSSYYNRVVDVMEELVKFTLLTRGCSNYLTSRYSERMEDAEKRAERVSLKRN